MKKKQLKYDIREYRRKKPDTTGGGTHTHQSFDVFNNVHVPWIYIGLLYALRIICSRACVIDGIT